MMWPQVSSHRRFNPQSTHHSIEPGGIPRNSLEFAPFPWTVDGLGIHAASEVNRSSLIGDR